MPEYQSARALGIYLSMPDREIQTGELVRQALEDGKSIFVPFIHKPANEAMQIIDMLQLFSFTDLESLDRDAWNIPTLNAQSISSRRNALGGHGVDENAPAQGRGKPLLDLILMPGLAFDQSKLRLGHGKAFYDRYLTRYKEAMLQHEGATNMPILGELCLEI